MIVHTLCNTCFQVYELRIETSDVGLLKQLVPEGIMCKCPRHCGGEIMLAENYELKKLASDPRLKAPLPISVAELFKAVKGAGLPDEIPNSVELVMSMLKSSQVVDAFVDRDGKDIYLHELKLNNGTTIHLSAGRKGAQVLKVTRAS